MRMFRSQDLQRHASMIQEAAMAAPVIITYHDRPRFVLMTTEEYDRLKGRRQKAGAVNTGKGAPARRRIGPRTS